jgi:hypothetical protein
MSRSSNASTSKRVKGFAFNASSGTSSPVAAVMMTPHGGAGVSGRRRFSRGRFIGATGRCRVPAAGVRPWLQHPSVPDAPTLWQLLTHLFLLQDILGQEALAAGGSVGCCLGTGGAAAWPVVRALVAAAAAAATRANIVFGFPDSLPGAPAGQCGAQSFLASTVVCQYPWLAGGFSAVPVGGQGAVPQR